MSKSRTRLPNDQRRWPRRRLNVEQLETRRLLSSSPLEVHLPAMGADDVTLRLVNGDVRVLDSSTGITIASQPLADTNAVLIGGAANGSDQLRIDYSGGRFAIPITFDGGSAGADALAIDGASFVKTVSRPTGPGAGSIVAEGETIQFAGLESITDSTTATQRVFDLSALPGDAHQNLNARLVDDPGTGLFTFDANGTGAFVNQTAKNPTGALDVIGGPANTTFFLKSLDLSLQAPVSITGGTGNDTLVVHDGISATVDFDGGAGSNSVVNGQALGASPAPQHVLTNIDRPLLFIPGFGGTGADFDAPNGYNDWLLKRGPDPSHLKLEPIARDYSDIVQTLDNIGYAEGSTFFPVLWDWRLPVAVTNDSNDDGVLDDVTAISLRNHGFDSGVGYLAWYLKDATEKWQTLTGQTSTDVDIITHSTGGLVARAYLQSNAYTSGDADMPHVHNLIQVGVPEQGVAPTFNFLSNNWNDKAASRVLAQAIQRAYNFVTQDGLTIAGPNGTDITPAWLAAQADPQTAFVSAYIATLHDLLATYGVGPSLGLVGGNGLLNDINANNGLTTFINKVDHTTLVYARESDTAGTLVAHTGLVPSQGLANLLLPISGFLGNLPDSDQVWYSKVNAADGGDGTVPFTSSAAPYVGLSQPNLTLVEIKQADAFAPGDDDKAPVQHTQLVINPYSQKQIIHALNGTQPGAIPDADVSTDIALSAAESASLLVLRGMINPIDYVNDGLAKVQGFIHNVQSVVQPVLDTKLPIVDKSISDYLNDPANGIAYSFFQKLQTVVSHIPSNVSLADAEARIDSALGLTHDQFNITFTDSVLSLNFDLDLSKTIAGFYTLDLSAAHLPLEGAIPLDLELDLKTKFSLQVDFAGFIADPHGGVGTDAVRLAVDQFEIGAKISSDDINVALNLPGLGSLAIEGGAASIGGVLNIGLNNPDHMLSLADVLTATSVSDVLTFEPQVPLNFHLPVTLSANTSAFQISGTGVLDFSSDDLLSGAAPDFSLDVGGVSLRIGPADAPIATITGATVTMGGADSNQIHIEAAEATVLPGRAFTVAATGLSGDLNLDTGAFAIGLETFDLAVSSAFEVSASDIAISYDPDDPAADQQIMSIGGATINFPKFGLSGELSELLVRKNGFSFGALSLTKDEVHISDIVTATNLTVTMTDFGITFGEAVDFSGSIEVSAQSASLAFANLSASVSDGTSNDGKGLSATFQFENNALADFVFTGELATIKIGSFVTITAQDFTVDTSATGDTPYVSFSNLSATIGSGSFSFSASVDDMAFLEDGSFAAGDNFGFDIDFNGGTSTALKWPSWLPITISQFGISWDDFNDDPTDFTISLSASVKGLYGLPLEVQGTIEDVQIDIGKLVAGQFPIVGLGAAGISVKGDLFGGTIDASLVFGIARIGQNNQLLPDSGPGSNASVKDSIFYGGLQGGFSMGGTGGFYIQIGLSELGPLGVLVSASLPTGILLEPISGLSINDFTAGVEFSKSLPSIDDPTELRDSAFTVGPTTQTPAAWLAGLKEQVYTQYVSNPTGNFLAVFQQPMIIEGSCTVFSQYVSQFAFNGKMDIAISTPDLSKNETGPKVMLGGTLYFIGNNLSMSAKLYADLSHLDQGAAKILFLSDIPDNPRILTLEGVATFNFVDAAGNPVTPNADEPAESFEIHLGSALHDGQRSPIAELVAPANLLPSPLAVLSGDATLAIDLDDSVLTLDVHADLSLYYLGTVGAAAGQFVLDPGSLDPQHPRAPQLWGALKLSGNLDKLKEVGLTVTATSFLEINTTNVPKSVSLTLANQAPVQVDLAPSTFAIASTGTFAFKQPAGSSTEWFRIDGMFFLQITNTGLDAFASGHLTIGTQPILDFHAMGVLVINSQGLAAHIEVGLAADAKGFQLNGDFDLEMNTTGVVQSFVVPQAFLTDMTLEQRTRLGIGANGSVSVAAGAPLLGVGRAQPAPYLTIHGDGDLEIGDLDLGGSFYLAVTPGKLEMASRFSVTVGLLGSLEGSATFKIDKDGLYGAALLTLAPASIPGVHIDASFFVSINTSSSTQTLQAYTVDTTNDATYGKVSTTTSLQNVEPGVHVIAGGKLILGDEQGAHLTTEGRFTFGVAPDHLDVALLGRVNLGALGHLAVNNQVSLSSAGIRAMLNLSAGAELPGIGFHFSGFYEVAINTTSAPWTVDRLTASGGRQSETIAAKSAKVLIGGELTLADVSTSFGSFNVGLSGLFDLEVGASAVTVGIEAGFNLFGKTINLVDTTATINFGGLVIDKSINLNFDIGAGVLHASGSANLRVNTTSQPVPSVSQPNQFIPAKTAELIISDVDVSLLSGAFSASGSMTIGFVSGGFSVNIPSSNPLSLNIFGLHASTWGYIDASGFSFTSTFGLTVGDPDILGADASLTVTISSSGFSGSFSAKGSILGVEFVGLHGSLAVSSSNVTLSITVSVPGLGDDTETWVIGHLTQPTLPRLTTIDQVMQLNLGADAAARGSNYTADGSENFDILLAPGVNDGHRVSVSALGYTETRADVYNILARNAGAGDDRVWIHPGVAANADLTAGAGNDQLIYEGSGSATLTGGSGTSRLVGGTGTNTFNGGAGAVVMTGGSGANTFNAGAGAATIRSGAPDDVVKWESGDGPMSVTGLGDTAVEFKLGGTNQNVVVSPTSGGFQVAVGAVISTFTGVSSLTFTQDNGSASIALGDMSGTGLTAVTMNLAGHAQADQILLQGSSAADAINVGSSDDSLSISLNALTITINGTKSGDTLTIHGGGGNDVIGAGGASPLASLLLYGDAADDTITGSTGGDKIYGGVGNDLLTSGGGNALYGEDGDDTITIGLKTLTADGGLGGNRLVVDDRAAGGLTATLSDTSLSGSDAATAARVIPYTKFGTRTLALGGGNNVVTVTGAFSGTTTITAGPAGSATTINLQTLAGANTVNSGGGNLTANVGSAQHRVPTVGSLVVNGGQTGTTNLTLDDTGNQGAADVTLNGSSVVGFGPSISYTKLSQLNVNLGAGGDNITINVQVDAAPIAVDAGNGNNAYHVTAAAKANVTANAGTGTDNYDIHALPTGELSLAANSGAGGDLFSITIDGGGKLRSLGQTPVAALGNGSDTVNAAIADGGSFNGAIAGDAGDTLNLTMHGAGGTGVSASGVGNVNFTSDNAALSWTFDQNKLSLPTATTPQIVLDNTGAVKTTLNLQGEIVVQSVDHPTSVTTSGDITVGGGGKSLSAIQAALTVTGIGSPKLVVDDSANTGSGTRTLILDAKDVRPFGSAGSIHYEGVAELEVDLSSADDGVTLNNTSAPITLLTGGGKDSVDVKGLTHDSTIDLGGGDGDAVNVFALTKDLTITGNGTANVTVDRTRSTAPATATLSSSTAPNTLAVAITGLGNVKVRASALGADGKLYVTLGSGNDALTINNKLGADSPAIAVNGGPGDDAFTVTGAGRSLSIDGGAGKSNTVIASIADVADMAAFGGLALNGGIAKLTVRNDSPTAGVQWVLRGADLLANGKRLIGTAGAAATTIDGSATDTLEIDASNGTAMVSGNQVDLVRGLNVLQFQAQTGAMTGLGKLIGLGGAGSVTTSPDGQFVYVTGETDDAITVYQRNAATNQLTYVQTVQPSTPMPGAYHDTSKTAWDKIIQDSKPADWYKFNDAANAFDKPTQAVIVENKLLYVISQSASTLRTYAADDLQVPEQMLQTIPLPQPPVAMATSTDGKFIYVVTGSGSSFTLRAYQRNLQNGQTLSAAGSIALPGAAPTLRVAADGTISVPVGEVVYYYSYTPSTQSFLNVAFQGTGPGVVTVIADRGILDSFNRYTATTTDIQIYENAASHTTTFAQSGVRDLRPIKLTSTFEVIAVSASHAFYIITPFGGASVDTLHADPGQLAPTPRGTSAYDIYATNADGSIVSWSLTNISDGFPNITFSNLGLPASAFPLGAPTSLSVSSDGQQVYAAVASSPVVYLLDRNTSTGKLTFNRVLGEVVHDYAEAPNKIHGVALGVGHGTGPIDGAAVFTGAAGQSIYFNGGTDITSDWTAEFVLTNEGDFQPASLLDGASASLRLSLPTSNGQVGLSTLGSGGADFKFVPTVVTPRKLVTDVTFVGISSGASKGVSVYINGLLAGTTSQFISLPMSSLGKLLPPKAHIDEVVIYKKALLPAEILAHVEASKGDLSQPLTAQNTLVDPQDIVASPDGKFVYSVQGGLSGSIDVFSRDQASGRLTLVQVMTAGLIFSGDLQVGISGDGSSLFVAAASGLIWYKRDANTGFVQLWVGGGGNGLPVMATAAPPAANPNNPPPKTYIAAAVSPLGFNLYTYDAGPQNLNASPTFYNAAKTSALALTPDGKFAYAAAVTDGSNGLVAGGLQVWRVDGQGSAVNPVQSLAASKFNNAIITSLSVSADGKFLYATCANTTYLMSIDSAGKLPTTPTDAHVAMPGTPAVFVAPDNQYVYEVGQASLNQNQAALTALSRNIQTGALTTVASFVYKGSKDVSPAISGLQSLVTDGRGNLFAVSPTSNALVRLGASLNLLERQVNGYNGDLGLQGATAVALAKIAGLLYVVSPVQNSVTAFESAHLELEDQVIGAAVGVTAPRSVAVTPSGTLFVYVGGQNGVAVFNQGLVPVANATNPLPQNSIAQLRVSPDGAYVYAVDDIANKMFVLTRAANGALTKLQTIAMGGFGGSGLNKPTDIAVSSDNTFVYVSSAGDGTVVVFRRQAGGTLALASTAGAPEGAAAIVQQGVDGVGGLGGARSVALLDTATGHYLIVAGQSDDALAIFQRDTVSGLLTFVQVVANNVAGASGLRLPSSIAVDADGAALYVASASTSATAPGGVAQFKNLGANAVLTVPPPASIQYKDIETLTISANNGSASVTVLTAPAADSLKVTAKSSISVTLNDQAQTTTIEQTGSGATQVFVDSSDIHGSLLVTSGSAGSAVTVQRAAIDVTVNGGVGDDIVRVAVGNISGGSVITVHGSANSASGDTLIIDPAGQPINPQAPPPAPANVTKTVALGSAIVLSYDNVENVQTLTVPVIGQLMDFSITAGDSLLLSASVINPMGGTMTVAWDINGDGVFGDATGSAPTLTWAQLMALGIDLPGTYPLAVQATNAQGTTLSTTTLAVAAKAPVLTVALAGSNTNLAGDPFKINFSATEEGNYSVSNWVINWGDGTPLETFAGSVSSATHTYGTPNTAGGYTITVQAIDAYLSASKTLANNVINDVPPTVVFDVPASGIEGSPITVSAAATSVVDDAGLTYAWTVKKNGQSFTTSTDASFTFTPDAATQAVDSYLVSLTVRDKYGASVTKQQAIAVADAAPTVVAVAMNDVLAETIAGTFTVTASDAGGTASIAHYMFDFDNDGIYQDNLGASALAHAFAEDGTYTVNVKVQDAAGLASDPFTITVVVLPSGPTVAVSGADHATQGLPYTLMLGPIAPMPGDTDAITGWTINWGDGVVETAAGNAGSAAHTYLGHSQYTISATVTDEDGVVAAANQVTVTVAAASPVLTISGATTVNEGVYTLDLAASNTFADALAGWTITWGDGAIESIFGNPSAVNHLYVGASTRTITATANNGLHDFNANSLAINVSNLPPVIVAVTTIQAFAEEGTDVEFAVTASDIGELPLTYAFDFGGGFVNSGGNRATHAFAHHGTYPVQVRVRDAFGGETIATYGLTVHDVAPKLNLTAPAVVDVGATVQLHLTFTDPGNDAVLSYSVNWGDGVIDTLPGTSLHPTHVYRYANIDYTATVFAVATADNPDFGVLGSKKIMVNDVPPTIALSGPASAVAGLPYRLTFGDVTDPGPVNVTAYTIFWGDGTKADFTGAPPAGGTVEHTYAAPGLATIKVTLVDHFGPHQAAGQLSLTVQANAAPVANAGGPYAVLLGNTVALDAGASRDADQPAASLTYAWDFDADGQFDDATGATPTFTATSAYGPGTFTVFVRVTDTQGLSHVASAAVDIQDVAPTADIANSGPVNEGSPVTVSLTNAASLSNVEMAAGFHYSFATNAAALAATYQAAGANASQAFTFGDNGSYVIYGRIFDAAGSFTGYQTTILVNNKVPTADLPAMLSAVEASPVTVAFANPFDASNADTAAGFRYSFATNPAALATSYAAAGLAGTQDFTFADSGLYTVYGRIFDKDGGFSDDATTIQVSNVAPTAVLSNSGPVFEGSTSATVSFAGAVDPSNADVAAGFRYSYDFGNTGKFQIALSAAPAATVPSVYLVDGLGSLKVRGRITDKDGGFTDYTTTLRIDNLAPTATLTTGAPVKEGASAVVRFVNHNDPSPIDQAAGFTYGYDFNNDGVFEIVASGSDSAPIPQSYLADGPASSILHGRITDKDGGFNDYYATLNVVNVAPTATLTNAGPVDLGTPVTVRFSNVFDPSTADVSAGLHFSYALSQAGLATTYAAAVDGASRNLTFQASGSVIVWGRVFDADGGFTDSSTTVTVVNNSPSALTLSLSAAHVQENGGVTLKGSFIDPAMLDMHRVSINWGDGQADTIVNLPVGVVAFDNISHVYLDNPAGQPGGSFPITVTVTDDHGRQINASTSVAVDNIAPTATLTNDGPINEGATATIRFANAFDPSGPDKTAGFHYSFALTQAALAASYAAAGVSNSQSFAFSDNGSYTVFGRVFDKDGGFTAYTTTVTVNNVAPTASLSNSGPINEGGAATVSFNTPSDPSAADAAAGFRYSFALSQSALAGSYAAAGAATTKSFPFGDNGSYTVYGRVFDKDGGRTDYTSTVTVNNRPPAVTAALNQAAMPGVAASFQLGSFSDAGVQDNPWALDVNWGDGSAHTSATLQTQGTLAAQSHTYAIAGSYTVTITVIDKDGGHGSATFQINAISSLFVLNASAAGALSLSGSANVNVPGGIVVNSNSSQAISASGNAHLTSPTIRVRGNIQVTGNASVSGTVTTGVTSPNPLAGLSYTTTIPASPAAVNVSGNNSTTINPGTYASITVSGNGRLTMNPGIYVIAGGGLSVSGSGALSGQNVAIYNTRSSAGVYGAVSLGGNGAVSLTPRPSGQALAGIVIFQDPADTRAMSIGGNAALGLSGTVYAPSAQITVSGNGATGLNIIADQLRFSGNGSALTEASAYAGEAPVPSAAPLFVGTLWVSLQGDDVAITAAQQARVDAALAVLNQSFGPYGATLVEVDPAAPADVRIHLASTSPGGGMADGILGFTTADDQITLVAGWDWYTGADAKQIGTNQYDFQTVVTHELGHALGLAHSDDAASVMYPALSAGAVRRSLVTTDLARLETVAAEEHGSALHAGRAAAVASLPAADFAPALSNAALATEPKIVAPVAEYPAQPGVDRSLSRLTAAVRPLASSPSTASGALEKIVGQRSYTAASDPAPISCALPTGHIGGSNRDAFTEVFRRASRSSEPLTEAHGLSERSLSLAAAGFTESRLDDDLFDVLALGFVSGAVQYHVNTQVDSTRTPNNPKRALTPRAH